ncbi:UNVERIFIED_CONTAM: hypothetical protein Slati_2232600 [Sesamum latifolium]|uniref:Uncharacterized protein n=1 Tax=Sesamum latifolium TaxID=2727402 RepID=A0AAW2WST4_9LAMI
MSSITHTRAKSSLVHARVMASGYNGLPTPLATVLSPSEVQNSMGKWHSLIHTGTCVCLCFLKIIPAPNVEVQSVVPGTTMVHHL